MPTKFELPQTPGLSTEETIVQWLIHLRDYVKKHLFERDQRARAAIERSQTVRREAEIVRREAQDELTRAKDTLKRAKKLML